MSTARPFSLSLPAPVTPVGGLERLPDGTPTKLFKRDLIVIGKRYVNKSKDAKKNFVLEVPENRAAMWLSTFESMKAAGVPIKATKNHLPRTKAESVVGDIEHVYRDGDRLVALVRARGEQNIALAEANKDVSVEIEPEKIDGDGTRWGEHIAAVSFVPNPVVNGQRIAASLDEPEYPTTYYLSTGDDPMPENQPPAFDLDGHFRDLEDLMGLPKGSINADNAKDHVKAHKARSGRPYMCSLDDMNQGEQKEVKRGAKVIEMQIDTLKGRFSPASVKGLKDILVGDGKRYNLSLAEDEGCSQAEAIIEWARKAVVTAEGEQQSRLQNGVSLSLDESGRGGGDCKPMTAERRQELLGQTDLGRAVMTK